MIGPLVQIALLVGMSHLVRALTRWVGPRRGGLLMGIPSTTALVLVGSGVECGLDDAMGSAEACLAGLVAASALPVVYARAAAAGWRSPTSGAAAITAYGVVSAGLWWLPGLGPEGYVAVAGAGVFLACHLAMRSIPAPEGGTGRRPGLGAAENRSTWAVACRSAVPTVYAVTIGGLRALAGPTCAGRFLTFPGTSLTVLVTTHMESGPSSACRLAAAMPAGGLGMLAFLTVFRFGCPRLGLGWGTAIGYAAALAVLAAAGRSPGTRGSVCEPDRANATARPGARRRARMGARGRQTTLRHDPASPRTRRPRVVTSRGRRPGRRRRGFSPRVECLGR